MDAKQALLWMETFNKKIQENKDYLSELDSPIGDGDHGATWREEWLPSCRSYLKRL